ncbi:MAG: YkgJ family cysteine cluster protein [Alphaproteobacteria bacterium]|nr:YkgJ family cysteine cluster protein [Alphaproteobacteria bacterium]
MSERSILDGEMKAEIFSGIRASGSGNSVVPVQLKPEDSFCFSCHRGVSCWNRCCHGADITLTPYDILRLSRHFGIRPREALLAYTVPAMWDKAELPVAKLKMGGDDGKGPCAFMTEEGCSIYENRPATCRYYPLGLASMKMKGDDHIGDFYFLVKEPHCRGHDEKKDLTVSAFREEQGVTDHDRVNRGWIDILMKMSSWKVMGGPWGQEPSPQTKRMFFMVSTDVDALRDFVFKTKFLDSYEVAPEAVEQLKTDDEALLQLGFDWMKTVLFNEKTLMLKERVLRESIARAREEMGAS